MVGDGVSDLEMKLVVDLFVGFGWYVVCEKVWVGVDCFIMVLDELNVLI